MRVFTTKSRSLRWSIAAFCFFSNLSFLLSASYYVSNSSGNDTNAGTLAAPFATIQRAANLAVAGDTVYVRAGVYRETITPVNSGTSANPITYQPYNGEAVTINGTELLTSWSSTTLPSGASNAYQAALASNFFTSTMNQSLQVFVDGAMLTLAKWPNTTTKTNAYPSGTAPAVDISHPAKSTITAFVSKTRNTSTNWTTGVVTDSALPLKSAGFYDGAEIFFQPNNAAWSWTFSGTVSSVPANSTTLTFTSRSDSGQDGSAATYQVGSRYYLFNKKEFLDTAGEWWHDKTNGQLYAIMPASDHPSSHTVEVKKRDYAFNLTDKNYITIKGFTLFACAITTDTGAAGSALGYDASGNTIYPWRSAGGLANSTGIVIDGITARYLNHFTDVSGHFFMQWGMGTGIVLAGTNHILRNSTIERTAGNGVSLQGIAHTVFNNTFNDISYAGVDCAAVNTVTAAGTSFPNGLSTDHEIAYNTIRRCGRSGITPRTMRNSNAAGGQFKARIHHNDIAHFGLQDWDVGGVYSFGGDNQFVRIDHNLVSEGLGFIAAGIYIDYGKNYIIDHNVIWNTEWGIKLHGHSNNENNCIVYNNTLTVRNTSATPYGPFAIGNGSGTNVGTVLRNNILHCFTPPTATGYQAITGGTAFQSAEQGNNLAWDGMNGSATDPKFTNRATTLSASNVDYSLLTGSAAIETGSAITSYLRNGITIPPFNDPIVGSNPDRGAYEFGTTPWKAGASATLTAPPEFSPAPNFYNTPTAITLTSLTPGAVIRYTTDGSTPTSTTGTIYTTPFTISTATTVKAIATAPGLSSSAVVSGFFDIYIPPPLGAPQNFNASTSTGSTVTLTWTDNSSAEEGTRIERRIGPSGTWQSLSSVSANITTATDTTAPTATEISYRAVAFNHGGSSFSSASNEATVITSGVFSQPGTYSANQVLNTVLTVPIQIQNVSAATQTFSIPTMTSGYVATNSSQAGGPEFLWNDISTIGSAIPELTPASGVDRDDQISASINLGFNFPFYGSSFNQIKVCSNGWLTFDTTTNNTDYNNPSLPSTSALKNLIAFLWDDLYFSNAKSSRAYTRSYDSTGGSTPDTFVLQFTNVVSYANQTGGTGNLQVVLKKDGSILMYYKTLEINSPSYTIGLNNSTGASGLQLAYNQALVTPNFAIRIAPGFGLTPSPTSLTLAPGATGTTQVTINASGLALGTNTASLIITSNLSRQPSFAIPFTLNVTAPSPVLQSFRTSTGLAADGSQDLLTPAGDGVPNLLKYAFNMIGTGTNQKSSLSQTNPAMVDPTTGTAGLPRAEVNESGKLQATFIRRKSSTNPGITYTVEYSDTLSTWASNPSAVETVTSIDSTFERVTVTDSVNASKRFVRVKVTSP